MLIKRADLFLIKNIGDKLKDKVFNIQTQYKLLKLIKIADEEKAKIKTVDDIVKYIDSQK